MSSMSLKTNKTKLKKLSKIFDADYYERGIESGKSNYKDYSWPRLKTYFDKTAQHIKQHFIDPLINKPNFTPSEIQLIDVGCAKGFLVLSLRNLGVSAIGIDASEYATSAAPEEVKDFIAHGIVEDPGTFSEFKENYFDIVTALDVLEHLDEKDVPQACKNLLFAAAQYVVICVPIRKVEGDLDITHKTIKPREWWEEQFMSAGRELETEGKIGAKVTIEPVDKYVDKNVWWFNIPEFLIVVKKEPRGL